MVRLLATLTSVFMISYYVFAQEDSWPPTVPLQTATWFAGGLLTPCGEAVVALLQRADQEGLKTELYRPLLDEIAASSTQETHLPLNTLLTQALLHYASWIAGMRPENTWDVMTHLKPQVVDLDHVKNLVCSEDPQAIAKLGPQHGPYQRLKKLLGVYLEQKKTGQKWPTLPSSISLNEKTKASHLRTLTRQLKMQGYTIPDADRFLQGIYHPGFRKVLRLFQLEHHLDPSGQLTPDTIKALNKSLDERIAQVRVNLERWRWFPATLSTRAIIVNIPTYELLLLEKGEVIDTLSIIVGKTTHQTPSFETCLTAITLNPSWVVPYSMATQEKLPAFQKNPERARAYQIRSRDTKELVAPSSINWNTLDKEHFPYILRLEPGPGNPLGPIKFTIPNPFSILMHGTSKPALFEKAKRAFSWGCIRISDPFKVAAFALNDPEWTPEKLKHEALQEKKTCVLKPKTSVPVYVTYFTLNVGRDGRAHCAPDLYQKDQKELAKLDQHLQDSSRMFREFISQKDSPS